MDEHVWSNTGPPGTGMVTGIMDHTRDANGHVHARLLDLVEGRSGKAYASWLKERGAEFTAGIRTAALDPFRGYANYLPDEDGISLLRSLQALGENVDAIMITAARDLATVRAAMRGGAVYYLVKPFGFEQLQTQLDAYRRWRREADARTVADQAAVDQLFNLRRAPSLAAGSRHLPPTMQKVLDTVVHAGQPISASDIADRIGISRPTAQRYLSELERKGRLQLHLAYGATGRPVNTYLPVNS